jgi:urease accessory protein UreF
MINRRQVALNDAAEWLGDWHPLAEQLGSTDGLVALSSAASRLTIPPVRNVPSLMQFLRVYQSRILLPFELPAIQSAHAHAMSNQLRELVALDRELVQPVELQAFAVASQRVGRSQLQKLRPLRDDRFVQRYLQAVEQGQAYGWHTMVYGVTLSVYSLPLRQGLLAYAHQTTRSFIYSAARTLQLSERACREIFEDLNANLSEAVNGLVGQPQVA